MKIKLLNVQTKLKYSDNGCSKILRCNFYGLLTPFPTCSSYFEYEMVKVADPLPF